MLPAEECDFALSFSAEFALLSSTYPYFTSNCFSSVTTEPVSMLTGIRVHFKPATLCFRPKNFLLKNTAPCP